MPIKHKATLDTLTIILGINIAFYLSQQTEANEHPLTDHVGRILYNTGYNMKDPLILGGLGMLGFVMFLATLAGIGGGAAILPITLLFFQFSPHRAVSHTAVYEFASTLSRVLYELFTTYGKPGKKRINFHIILIAAPAMFLGSFIGVNGNTISPESIILIGVTVILLFCVFMSFLKYLKKSKLEK